MTIDRIIIVPRWSGTAASDWYPWIQEQLAEDPGPSLAVELVVLDNPPVITPSVEQLRAALGTDAAALRSTLLVGHSVGCQALLRYLATLDPDSSGPAGLVCIAGWWIVDRPWPDIQPWIDDPYDLERTRAATTDRIQVLISDDDPFTSDWQTNKAQWESQLGARVQVNRGGRHFNGSEEPAVLELIRATLAGSRAS